VASNLLMMRKLSTVITSDRLDNERL
jgi:hypothetical protein